MEYPKDKLYLRVGNLITRLKNIANSSRSFNSEFYGHLLSISKLIKPGNNIDSIIETERYILSSQFLDKKYLTDADRKEIKTIIRGYKLNQLGI